MTMNAPVGPPMQTLVPPRTEIRMPAMTAVTIPACGGAPDAMANAIASGKATMPTVRPAMRSAVKSGPEYCLIVSSNFGRKERAKFMSEKSRWLQQFVLLGHGFLWYLGRRTGPQLDLLKHLQNLNVVLCAVEFFHEPAVSGQTRKTGDEQEVLDRVGRRHGNKEDQPYRRCGPCAPCQRFVTSPERKRKFVQLRQTRVRKR